MPPKSKNDKSRLNNLKYTASHGNSTQKRPIDSIDGIDAPSASSSTTLPLKRGVLSPEFTDSTEQQKKTFRTPEQKSTFQPFSAVG